MATSSDVTFRVSVESEAAKQELAKLGDASRAAATGADKLAESGEKAGKSTAKIGEGANLAQEALTRLGGALAGAFAFQELVQAAAKFESIKVGLQTVSGSAQAAASDLEFLRGVSNRIGADINDVGSAFLGLAAATKGTAVEGEPTRRVFESVAEAMSKAGKSSAETQNALVALSQIASKGTVSMEELRGQLGEALPGALQSAANGLGVTTQDLIKLVEQGKIAAEDLFPALANGLVELYGNGATGAQTLSQEIANVKNAFTELAADLGENGGLDALKTGAEIAGAGLVLLNDTLVSTGKTIGVLAAAVTSLDFSGLPAAFAEIEKESKDKLLKAASHNQVLANYVATLGSESTKTALAQQQAAEAAKKAGEAAESGGKAVEGAVTSYVSLSNTFAKVGEDYAKQIEAAQKTVAAREAEGKATTQLAQAFGTETEQREATAAAAAGEAEALTALAQLRLSDVALLEGELKAKRAFLEAQGGVSESREKELGELQRTIELRQAEADKAVAQAGAARIAAEAARAEAEAQRDNSARVEELRIAYENAAAALEVARQAKANGTAASGLLEQAELNAGRAATLYKDALNDQTAALQARQKVADADLDLKVATINLAKEQQQAILEVARATGDEKAAMEAAQEIKKLEIELLRLTAEAKRAEGAAALALIEVKRAELIATGQLTEAKKLELEASEKKALILIKEADIADTTAGKLEKLKNANLGIVSSSSSASGGIDRQADSMYRLADATEAAAEAERKRLNVDKAGFTLDSNGNRATMSNPFGTRLGIYNFLKQGGLNDEQATRVSSEFVNNQGNVPYFDNPGQLKYGGSGSSLSMALVKAIEKVKFSETTPAARNVDLQARPGSMSTQQSQRTTDLASYQQKSADFQAKTGYALTTPAYLEPEKTAEKIRTGTERSIQSRREKSEEILQKQLDDFKRTNSSLSPESIRQFEDRLRQKSENDLKTYIEAANNRRDEDLRRLNQTGGGTNVSQNQRNEVLRQINRQGVATGSTVNITIGGQRRTVRVTSDQDAAVLTQVLRALESQARRS